MGLKQWEQWLFWRCVTVGVCQGNLLVYIEPQISDKSTQNRGIHAALTLDLSC